MLFRQSRRLLSGLAGFAQLPGNVATILSQQVKIMSSLDDIKAGLDKVDSAIAAAESKIDADAQTIKDDVAKLAAFAAAPQGASDADLSPLVTRINAMADGLTKHLGPITDAVPTPPAGGVGATGTAGSGAGATGATAPAAGQTGPTGA